MTRFRALNKLVYHLALALRHATILEDRCMGGALLEDRSAMLTLLLKDLVAADQAIKSYVNLEKERL